MQNLNTFEKVGSEVYFVMLDCNFKVTYRWTHKTDRSKNYYRDTITWSGGRIEANYSMTNIYFYSLLFFHSFRFEIVGKEKLISSNDQFYQTRRKTIETLLHMTLKLSFSFQSVTTYIILYICTTLNNFHFHYIFFLNIISMKN